MNFVEIREYVICIIDLGGWTPLLVSILLELMCHLICWTIQKHPQFNSFNIRLLNN